jgi:hypothetical protein
VPIACSMVSPPLVASEIAMNRRIVSAAPVFARLVLIGGRLHRDTAVCLYAMIVVTRLTNSCGLARRRVFLIASKAFIERQANCQNGNFQGGLPRLKRASVLKIGERPSFYGRQELLF